MSKKPSDESAAVRWCVSCFWSGLACEGEICPECGEELEDYSADVTLETHGPLNYAFHILASRKVTQCHETQKVLQILSAPDYAALTHLCRMWGVPKDRWRKAQNAMLDAMMEVRDGGATDRRVSDSASVGIRSGSLVNVHGDDVDGLSEASKGGGLSDAERATDSGTDPEVASDAELQEWEAVYTHGDGRTAFGASTIRRLLATIRARDKDYAELVEAKARCNDAAEKWWALEKVLRIEGLLRKLSDVEKAIGTPERISGVALCRGNDAVSLPIGKSHEDAIRRAVEDEGWEAPILLNEQGFTAEGDYGHRFVSREEAWEIAKKARQILSGPHLREGALDSADLLEGSLWRCLYRDCDCRNESGYCKAGARMDEQEPGGEPCPKTR